MLVVIIIVVVVVVVVVIIFIACRQNLLLQSYQHPFDGALHFRACVTRPIGSSG